MSGTGQGPEIVQPEEATLRAFAERAAALRDAAVALAPGLRQAAAACEA